MSASIYYFSATGNSLHIARTIAEQLGECNLINMARPAGSQAMENQDDTVGIVFPVYYLNMPGIVRDFIKKLRLDPKAYVFGIATCGDMSGVSLHTLENLLKEKGHKLSAGFTLKMPDTAYAVVNVVTPPERRGHMLKASEDELAEIIKTLKKKEKHDLEGRNSILTRVGGGLLSTLVSDVYGLPKHFNVTDQCSNCGTCEKVCPVGNITRVDKKVTWGNKCIQCQACFHWCPRTAIQIGKKSANVARYHHPDIKVSDIIK